MAGERRAAPDAGRLPRPRGHAQRGGAPGVGARRRRARSPTPTIYDAVMAVQDGGGRPRDRADRERAGGQRRRHARHADRSRPAACGSRRRWCSRSHHCVIAPARDLAVERGARGVAPAGDRAVRPLPPRASPERRARSAPSTADAVMTVCRSDDAQRGARLAASRPSCTTATSSRPTSRTTPTTSPASYGSRARTTWPSRAPDAEDLDRLLGRRRRVAGLAGGRARRVRRARA